MHFKSPKLKAKEQMASIRRVAGGAGDDDGDGSRSTKSVSIGHSPRSCASNKNTNNNSNNNSNNNNNNNSNNDSISNSNSNDSEVHLKKQALEQRKEELERLLSQKSWLLQQLKKQETQILNGNYNYLNLNEIFNTLQQCKQSSGTALLRRKSTSAAAKVNHTHQQPHNNNNNNTNNNNNNVSDNNNRHSDVSSRSSEYDNYPNDRATAAQQSPLASSLLKVAPKQRQAMPVANWNSPNTLCQIQQHHQQQHQQHQPHQQQLQQQQQQLGQQYITPMTEQQHFQYTQQQILQKQHHHQQQQRQLLQHQHYHPRQQLITAYHSPVLQSLVQSPDGISLYSTNTTNVSTTMLQQQPSQHTTASAMHTPIVVNCDKYYLSPTHQSYSDGGFIKSSQNIKQYVSPLSSPNAAAVAYALGYEPPPPEPLPLAFHQQPLYIVNSRSFDAISLSPSLAATIDSAAINRDGPPHTNNHNNLRWRSQSNIQYNAASALGVGGSELKTHSSDMLRNPHSPSYPGGYFCGVASELNPKPLDDISVASFSSETQRKSKPKQWLESSLDGPPIRSSASNSPNNQQQSIRSNQSKPQAHMQRDRPRLSSQSMTAGSQRYASVIQRGKSIHPLQDDENKFAKFSQSTSYLNSIDALTINTYLSDAAAPPSHAADSPPPPTETTFHYNPPKIVTRPLPSQASKEKLTASPEIRIESPKNVRVVQQATFQPYKEVTKPFEMSDFYKYSTKFKQREATGSAKLETEKTGCGFSPS